MTQPQRPLRKAQVCPMCNAPLPAGALFCEACGTDLSRAGVVLSTYVRPVSSGHFSTARALRLVGLSAGVFAAITLALTGLGSIPQVSARVPAIAAITEPIRGALGQAVAWGSRMGRDKPAPVAVPAPTPVVSPPPPAHLPVPPPVPPAPTPYLIVRSSPAGAEVFMDKERVGKTPLTLKQLRPGTYTIRVTRKGYTTTAKTVQLKPNVGMTVALTLKRVMAPPAPKPAAKPTAPPTARPQARPAMPVGTAAPAFTLKDRRGVIYRLSDFRGRNVAVLFIWDLDERGRTAVRALAARTGEAPVVVVLARPNRIALRRFLAAESIAVPILLGNPSIAAEYRVPDGVAVLFLINDQGRIQSRQLAAKP